MKRTPLFLGPLRAILAAAGLLAVTGLYPCAADVALPSRTAPVMTKSHSAGSGIRIQPTVSSLAGDTVEVRLRLDGVKAPDGATLSYTLSGPGQIISQEHDRLPPGAVAWRRVTVRLTPGESHYLNVFTRQDHRSGVTSFSLDKTPVRLKAAPAGPITQDAKGRNVIVLPGKLQD